MSTPELRLIPAPPPEEGRHISPETLRVIKNTIGEAMLIVQRELAIEEVDNGPSARALRRLARRLRVVQYHLA